MLFVFVMLCNARLSFSPDPVSKREQCLDQKGSLKCLQLSYQINVASKLYLTILHVLLVICFKENSTSCLHLRREKGLCVNSLRSVLLQITHDLSTFPHNKQQKLTRVLLRNPKAVSLKSHGHNNIHAILPHSTLTRTVDV